MLYFLDFCLLHLTFKSLLYHPFIYVKNRTAEVELPSIVGHVQQGHLIQFYLFSYVYMEVFP